MDWDWGLVILEYDIRLDEEDAGLVEEDVGLFGEVVWIVIWNERKCI